MNLRHSFGPGDIKTVAILPDQYFVLEEVSNFSISSHFDKKPVRRLNNRLAVGWATGAATIAGSLICAQMTHGALWKIRRYAGTIQYFQEDALAEVQDIGNKNITDRGGSNSYIAGGQKVTSNAADSMAASIQPQELPPFHLMFLHFNNDGQMGLARLYNIVFTDYSAVKGVDNSITEETLQYQALYYEQLRLRRSLSTNQMQELLSGAMLPNDKRGVFAGNDFVGRGEVGFWNDRREPQLIDELQNLESIDNLGDYLVEETEQVVERTNSGEASSISVANKGDVVITDTETQFADVEDVGPSLEASSDETTMEDIEENRTVEEVDVIEHKIEYTHIIDEGDGLNAETKSGWLAFKPDETKLYLRTSPSGSIPEKPLGWDSEDLAASSARINMQSSENRQWTFQAKLNEFGLASPDFLKYQRPTFTVSESGVNVEYPHDITIPYESDFLLPDGTYKNEAAVLPESLEVGSTVNDTKYVLADKDSTVGAAPPGQIGGLAITDTYYLIGEDDIPFLAENGQKLWSGIRRVEDITTPSIIREPVFPRGREIIYSSLPSESDNVDVTVSVDTVFDGISLPWTLTINAGFTGDGNVFVEETNATGGAKKEKNLPVKDDSPVDDAFKDFHFPSIDIIARVHYYNDLGIASIILHFDKRSPATFEYQGNKSPTKMLTAKSSSDTIRKDDSTYKGKFLGRQLSILADVNTNSTIPGFGDSVVLVDGTEVRLGAFDYPNDTELTITHGPTSIVK